jgi:hypothetical protein
MATAELFDPFTVTFRRAGSMISARRGMTATLLASGRVLIAGGAADNSAELYDPASNSFLAAGMMLEHRVGGTATLLPDGRVYIVGGATGQGAMIADMYVP